jgi:multimeric flavodoxin WrbA
MKLANQRPSYYNVEEWGVPVNDLDQIATIGTFCATLIWLSFPRQGIFLTQQEKIDYVALWRYIGYLLGTPTDLFATTSKARAVMESLLYHEVQPSELSKVLANNIIRSLENQPPTYNTADMLIASARWLNGNDLADSLGLPRVSLYYWSLMAGQCLFFMTMSYGSRSIEWLDRRRVDRLKRIFWKVIVEAKWGLAGTETVFDFKYVPEYETVTDMGTPVALKTRTSSVEMRNLKTLGVFMVVAGVGSWMSLKIASSILSRIW